MRLLSLPRLPVQSVLLFPKTVSQLRGTFTVSSLTRLAASRLFQAMSYSPRLLVPVAVRAAVARRAKVLLL